MGELLPVSLALFDAVSPSTETVTARRSGLLSDKVAKRAMSAEGQGAGKIRVFKE